MHAPDPQPLDSAVVFRGTLTPDHGLVAAPRSVFDEPAADRSFFAEPLAPKPYEPDPNMIDPVPRGPIRRLLSRAFDGSFDRALDRALDFAAQPVRINVAIGGIVLLACLAASLTTAIAMYQPEEELAPIFHADLGFNVEVDETLPQVLHAVAPPAGHGVLALATHLPPALDDAPAPPKAAKKRRARRPSRPLAQR